MARFIDGIVFDGGIDEGSYLNGLPVVKHLTDKGRLSLSADITFFVGENGTGKSTLLEAIAVAFGFNAEGGTRNFSFTTNDTHSELHNSITLIERAHPKDGFF